jgi:hypothetical protein
MGGCLVSVIKRKPLVCIEKDCNKCEWGNKEVPEECDFKILHLLKVDDGGFQKRERHSGKTSEALHYAKKCAEGGYRVFFITPTMMYQVAIREELKKSGIHGMSLQNIEHLRGFSNCILITDEIHPGDISPQYFRHHTHLLGFYT